MRTGNVADLLRQAAADHGSRPALITDSVTHTWADLDRAADAGAAALRAAGLTAGSRLLIQLPTSPELALALLAGARADLIVVPTDPARADTSRIAGRVQAALVIGGPQVSAPAGFETEASAPHMTQGDIAQWWSAESPARIDPTTGGEDIAMLARASRSDKAVMLSHRALLAAVEMINNTTNLNLQTDDRVLQALPLFHLAGFATTFLPLAQVGGAAVIPQTPQVTGPNVSGTASWTGYTDSVLSAIHDHHVTVLPGAPALYRLLLRAESLERSLASVRLMTSGASPLNPQDFAAMKAKTGSAVWEGYGISEGASVVATTLMTKSPKPRSVGVPLPGIEIRFGGGGPEANDHSAGQAGAAEGGVRGQGDQKPEAKNQRPKQSGFLSDDARFADFDDESDPGRISIRGENLFSGYWPDGAGGPDADGWFATADVGYLDPAGELHLIDRASETVTVSGFTVYPREVESALLSHPYVRDVAVIGLPGRVGTELVAVIVASRGTTPTADDLAEHVATLLPAFKRPSAYHVVPILPRTELGRLDRDAVREEWAAKAGIDLRLPPPRAAGLKVVTPGAAPIAPLPPLDKPQQVPEVIDVSNLEGLGSRLPGVHGRSQRSRMDTDDDLFGEDFLGEQPEPQSQPHAADSTATNTADSTANNTADSTANNTADRTADNTGQQPGARNFPTKRSDSHADDDGQ
ncbi:long-chain fatty acid--CoA ligase [Nakamurella antarctica]|uniref:Long-chain fatty acid--CoA ligase n=1 Tax=Nakamurella antarctica TaxID=1902245 RepID=A0A3G8ZWF5_9ACTN|nr:class I adenylate-forming enzyme family protein [Nakamurella antarctica]AZI58764.1 long-chain fatty acid--CoA ligase [Nakamurella antarctica]